ncbi:sensor domain-containing diguanylate cyclase [Marinomonas sp. THO17]|uniref:sensor domain-containing diguanylate cyclase n=1 Tax=Marinomonas sp. THO17 TaxID=3149048 RepID=UPI00336BB4F3
MQAPDLPENETSRLNNLRSLCVLDTPPEERFDRVTRIAKRMFNVPIALISLVDENRQWFKSCIGLDAVETSRDVSFCGHAILGSEPFIIPDASKDQRFHDNPLVTGAPYIRFYAGVPLSYVDGSKLGTLCIIDDKPHFLTNEDIEDLVELATMAQNELIATHIATTDELTNVLNRRGFMSQSHKQIASGDPLKKEIYTLAYFDLNGFKQINDQFGHQMGDKALKNFAALLQQKFRHSDIVGRLGGDEFVVLLRGATLEQGEQMMVRFKEAVQDFNKESKQPFELKFSVGLTTTHNQEMKPLETLIYEADQYMYQNKSKQSKAAH